jgi:quercetin dioxygenase-like cupin family protein
MASLARAATLGPRLRAPGWAGTELRGRGADCFAAARWDLEAGATTGRLLHEDGETVLYVLEGRGRIVLADADHQLEEESVVWLEPGDGYRIDAAEGGLAILTGTTTGGGTE